MITTKQCYMVRDRNTSGQPSTSRSGSISSSSKSLPFLTENSAGLLQMAASQDIPLLVMGGSGFSNQIHPDPKTLPAVAIVKKAFDLGLRAIDTSPYYDPSEQILGEALGHPDITSSYQREDYFLMTKVGRIAADVFDYSPEWIEKSVNRSLQRLKTSYLDVVFCHDVEFVTLEEAIIAVGALFKIATSGRVRRVGVSGYDIDRLVAVANGARERYGKPIDVVQCWAQLTLQNTQLQKKGFEELRKAGVSAVCSSSPLGSGLLTSQGPPEGKLGDWHPAPKPLRKAAKNASEWVQTKDETLESLALRFAIVQAMRASTEDFRVTTIVGVGKMKDLEENVRTTKQILRPRHESKEPKRSLDNSLEIYELLNEEAEAKDAPLWEEVQSILGEWLDYGFGSPAKM